MLGVAALVIAILFGTTILGELRIKQTVKDLQDRATEVKHRFPMLATMEAQARRGLRDIEVMFGAEDWLDERYENLEISQRQRILTVEHLIALEFAGRSTAPQLRGMANFYYSKYKAEGLASDLDRALYYALLAAERGNEKFQYLNDFGLIYDDLARRDHTYSKNAQEAWEKSKTKQPAQQRCYYNLAFVKFIKALELRQVEDLEAAHNLLNQTRDLLVTALKHPNWELQASPELTSLVHYNLSCCLCRLAEADANCRTSRHHHLDEAIAHLQKASKFRQTKRSTLEVDLWDERTGDLYTLANNPLYAEMIRGIERNFEAAWEAAAI
jgi:hypothetical protein